MLIPQTYAGALILIVLSMICWGSWANTFKLAGKWRFELFYYDYSLGVLLAAIIAAYTFGSMGDDLSFSDNMIVAGKRNMAYALAGGVVFNLANMLLVAAISVAGLAVAFPIGIGLALVVGVVWNYFLNPQGNPLLLTAGVVLVVGAIIVDALAYASHAAGAKTKGPAAGKGKHPPKAGGAGLKGIGLSLISGVLMGSFYPLVEMAKGTGMDAAGLGPYAVAFMFAIGVFFSTFIFNLYFLNLPVQGEPLSMFTYFQGTLKQHALGIAGGLLWCMGAIANFTAASAPKSVEVGPAVSYAIGQGATMVSALWGLLVWKEFAGARPKVRMMLAVMLLLFIAGLVLVSIAPLYVNK
jgi:glucose uptake protein